MNGLRVRWGAWTVAGVLLALLSGCRPDYPKCNEDSHCADKSEVCVNETCKQCRTDAQCAEGYICQEGACLPAPECAKNKDCPAGERCQKQKCVPECGAKADCGDGQRCKSGRCVAVETCEADADCGKGRSCDEGKCVNGTPDPSLSANRRDAKVPGECELGTVFFEFNEYGLSDATRNQLERNADCMRRKKRAVMVEGHCDERGTEEYNLVLGARRADGVKRYLIGLGVADKLVRTISYGKERPKNLGHDDASWTLNRRAEFLWQP